MNKISVLTQESRTVSTKAYVFLFIVALIVIFLVLFNLKSSPHFGWASTTDSTYVKIGPNDLVVTEREIESLYRAAYIAGAIGYKYRAAEIENMQEFLPASQDHVRGIQNRLRNKSRIK